MVPHHTSLSLVTLGREMQGVKILHHVPSLHHRLIQFWSFGFHLLFKLDCVISALLEQLCFHSSVTFYILQSINWEPNLTTGGTLFSTEFDIAK